MQVTDLKQKGKSESYYISLDDEPKGTIELETLVKHHIKLGSSLSEDEFISLKKESDKLVCFSVSLKYISSRLKTEKQMRDYLYGKNFDGEAITIAIEKLKAYGYLNDEYYAKVLSKNLETSKGKRYIRQELKNRGVKEDIILNTIDTIEDEDTACKNVCTKWLKNKPLPLEKKDKEKLYRFLLSRGFEYGTIRHVLNSILEEDIED